MNGNPLPMPSAVAVSPELLEQFSRFVAGTMGLHFPQSRWRTLEQGVAAVARNFGFADAEACIRGLMAAPLAGEQIEILASCLTVGETYFWREEKSFATLRETILPELIRTRKADERSLRIWSAGCSTGEEPYSIAILLDRLSDLLTGWKVSILATDINAQALHRAQEGIYGEWSFRKTTPAWVKSRYFTPKGAGRLEILPRIREMVQFAYLNLVEDSFPSLPTDTNAIDVIFCRNVLMYFTPERAGQVIARFHRSLLEGGWLVVSPCEASALRFSRFAAVSFPEAIFFRKQSPGATGTEERKTIPRQAHAPPVLRSSLLSRYEVPPVVPVVVPRPPLSPPPLPEPSPYEHALTLCAQGAYAAAAEQVATLLVRNERDTRALALLCRIHANQGRLGDALHDAERALAADRLDAGLHYLRGLILQEMGQIDEAIAALKKALYQDQDLILAHFTLGNLFLRKGRTREARRHFNNALALLGNYPTDDPLPESEGMSAGRLTEIIRSIAVD